jgi:hypothetical protein
VLCLASLMIVLDVTIVNVALPSIRRSLAAALLGARALRSGGAGAAQPAAPVPAAA